MTTLRIGDIDYPLKLKTINDLCALERAFSDSAAGVGINQVIARFVDPATLKMRDVLTFLEVTLRDSEGKKLDPDRVHELTAIAGVEPCCNAVASALVEALAILTGKKADTVDA